MDSKRTMKRGSYVVSSVGLAVLIIFTALPYYCLTSIALPGWNIYWSYGEVQEKMFFLFPGLAFLGAVTTLKKRNSFQDVLINVAAPLNVLLILKALQYYPVITFEVLIAATAFTVYKVKTSRGIWRYDWCFKKIRLIYYVCRKQLVYFLLFVFAPLAVWIGYQEYARSDEVLTQFQAEKEEMKMEETSELHLVTEEEWETLTAEERFGEVKKIVAYETDKLGVGSVDLFAVKELIDGRAAYYSHEDHAISVNIIYLNQCSLEEAAHVAAHEAYHGYQNRILDSLKALEEAGIDVESLAYYEEAIELKKAFGNYYLDSLSFDSYSANLMEVQAEIYADEELKEFRDTGVISK